MLGIVMGLERLLLGYQIQVFILVFVLISTFEDKACEVFWNTVPQLCPPS